MPTRTFLFVDQVGSTQQLTALGDQATHEIRRALFDLLRQATEVSGGHEVDFTGDGLFSAFEGAGEAVDAAVLMQQLCASFNRRQPEEARLALRIGLNTGEPLTSEGGGYFGVAVVIASRLCSTAQEGQILVSDIVRSLVEPRGTSQFRSVGALPLRGVPDPVPAFAVSWAPDDQPARLPEGLAARRTGPFVGRAAEQDRAGVAWAEVQSGGRRVVLVSGDQGRGVSRLLAEIAERLRLEGATVWFGRAGDRRHRLGPWTEALQGWAESNSRAELRLAMGPRAADLLRLVPALADLVPRLPAPAPVDPEMEVFLIAAALDDLCARWSQHQPIVMVLDDLQNADPASLTVLRRLAESSRPGRLLLLAGYEPVQVGASPLLATVHDLPNLVDLRLEGLSATEVQQLVAAETEDEITPVSLRAVLAESDGSPYFVLQMARSMRERAVRQRVVEAVSEAETLRTDLRLRREEITLGLRQLDQLTASAAPTEELAMDPEGTEPVPGPSPYQGLAAFETEDAENFFGRETLTAELVARLVSSRFLAVVGPSGSGKSSVVRAGVLPTLASGALPGSAAWVTAVCRPGADDVVGVLAGARQRAGGRPVLLFVDQFEEVWTQQEPSRRQRVLDRLVTATTDPESADIVVVAMRADYYGYAAEHPPLAGLMAESHVLTGPMTASELRAAIERPATRAGLVLEPGLAQAVIDDLGDQPGSLPLLSTALRQVWERRRGRTLTLSGYAEAGGARRAIAYLADSIYDGLDPQQQVVAQQILLRLAAPGAEGEDVARPAALAEFADDEPTRTVLARLVDGRLVTVGSTSVQVAHEALLREWPRLRGWLEVDRDGRRLQHQIATAAGEWRSTGRDDALLLRGVRLAAAEDWRQAHPEALTPLEQEYLTASVDARRTELARARRSASRLRLLALGLVILLVGAIAAGGIAVAQRQAAQDRANEADAGRLSARAISLAGSNVDTAMLLAVEGYRRAPSLDTEDGLLTALNGARFLAGYHRSLPPDVYDVALTTDQRTLVVMTAGGDLGTVDTTTWEPTGDPLVRGVSTPGNLAVSRDGRLVAYGAEDGVRILDRTSGHQIGKALGGAVGFTQDFSRDSRVLVTSTEEWSGFRAFEVRTGRQLGQVADPGGPVAVDVSPRTDEVVVGLVARPALQRYRFDGSPVGAEVSVADRGAVRLLAYTPDGSRIAVVHDSGVVQVVDAATLAPVGRSFTARAGNRVVDVSFTPSGQLVAAAADDGSVQVVEVETGLVVATFSGLSGPVLAEFLDDQRLLAVTSGEAAEFDLRRPTSLGTAAVRRGAVLGLSRSPDADPVMAVGEESRFDRVRAALDSAGGSSAPPDTDAVAIAADHSTVAWHVVPPDPAGVGAVVVTDAVTGKVRTRVEIPGDRNGQSFTTRMALSSDGSRVAVGTAEGRLSVVDVTAGALVISGVALDFTALPALRWSPDATTLYTGGQDGLLKFVDPVTGRVRRSVPLSSGTALTDIDPVPDSSLVAVSSESGAVYLVDTTTGQLSGEPLSAGATGLQAVAVTPSGQRIAALGGDGAVRVWDRATRRAVGPPLAVHYDWSFAMDYLDETRLMSGGLDRQLISWDLAPESLVRQACRLAGRDLTPAEWEQYLPTRPYRRTCSG